MKTTLKEQLHEKYGVLMDLDELALLMKQRRRTLYQQIYRGKFEIPYVKNGNKFLFRTDQVVDWFEDNVKGVT